MRTVLLVLLAAVSVSAQSRPSPSLRIYAIDVELGKATLYVSPSGESLLFDAGRGGPNNHAERIIAAARAAGVKQIDYLVISHYHEDHIGGVAALASKIPIKAFFDPGERVTKDMSQWAALQDQAYAEYVAVRKNYPHTGVRPGDTIPVKGINVAVVAAAGHTLTKPLEGAGQPNPSCRSFKAEPAANTDENAHSLGLVVTFGNMRIADFADLRATVARQLTCPVNSIGTVDLYLPIHHGGGDNVPEIVHALRPRAAIMTQTGPRSGGDVNWDSLHSSQGFQDLWQLHRADNLAKDRNSTNDFIANPIDPDGGKWIEASATADGAFTVRNSRNGFQKTYSATPR